MDRRQIATLQLRRCRSLRHMRLKLEAQAHVFNQQGKSNHARMIASAAVLSTAFLALVVWACREMRPSFSKSEPKNNE